MATILFLMINIRTLEIILAKETTELVLLFHKKTIKLVFLYPNMSQKNIKVLNIIFTYHVKFQQPVLEALTDPALHLRHWQEIDEALGRHLPEGLTLSNVEEMGLHSHSRTLKSIAHKANMQREMEEKLCKVSFDENLLFMKHFERVNRIQNDSTKF